MTDGCIYKNSLLSTSQLPRGALFLATFCIVTIPIVVLRLCLNQYRLSQTRSFEVLAIEVNEPDFEFKPVGTNLCIHPYATAMARSRTMPVPSKHHAHHKEQSATGNTATRKPEPSTSTHHGTSFFSRGNRHQPEPKATSSRRPMPNRQESFQTRYMEMLLSLDTIPRLHNIYASLFTWILLAGFVVFPGTFVSIKELSDDEELQNNQATSFILRSVKNIPLLVVAAVCCGLGAFGMVWLSIRWRQNYVWLLNRLFLPGILNSLAGLISSLISVYGQQHGDWSITAKVTAIVEGASMGVCIILFVVYNNLLLNRVKKKHGREMERWRDPRESDEGFMEKVERKAKEPALEPGSVV
jgi:hypothetical protein